MHQMIRDPTLQSKLCGALMKLLEMEDLFQSQECPCSMVCQRMKSMDFLKMKLMILRIRDISILCAKEISHRYEGKRCMGTTIHALTPSFDNSDNFFFDEEFLQKFHHATPSMQSTCAGSHYYTKQLDFVEKHYVAYDGGIEGIRNGCLVGDKMCDVHNNILGCSWRGPPINRVPQPVSSESTDKDGFHYTNPDLAFSLDKVGEAPKVDEYCPRVKIEEAIRDIGPLDLECTNIDVAAEKPLLVDRNDTLGKMLGSVDDIVSCIGEDLRQVVEYEMKRRHQQMVKAHSRKAERASSKKKELAKSVYDIDWEVLIKNGTVKTLYVSQLDKYLSEFAGYTKAELSEKGFSKDKKAEAIKKHFYQNQPTAKSQKSAFASGSNRQKSAYTASPNASTPGTSRSTPTDANSSQVNVLPWGGDLFLQGRMVTLTNTCPIDNCLMIIYLLSKQSSKISDFLAHSNEVAAQTLCKCFEYIDAGEYSMSKLEWLDSLNGMQPTSPVLDVWGNEETLFTQHLMPLIKSCVSSSCSSPMCPLPGVQLRWANTVALRCVKENIIEYD